MGTGNRSSWPAFCSFCQRAGHAEAECFRKNLALKPAKGAGTHGLKPTASSNKEGTTAAIEETNGSQESDKITMGDAVTPTERPGAPTLTPEVQRPGGNALEEALESAQEEGELRVEHTSAGTVPSPGVQQVMDGGYSLAAPPHPNPSSLGCLSLR